jgi:hypothetical protein
MKAAEDGRRYDAAHVLDGAMDRTVLVERSMSPQLVIVGGIPRSNSFATGMHSIAYCLSLLKTSPTAGTVVFPPNERLESPSLLEWMKV